MQRILLMLMSLLLAVMAIGCGNKEQAKGGDEKKAKTQKAQTTQTEKPRLRQNDQFNHSASLKMQEVVKEVPEVTDPVIVVYEKDAVLGYQVKGNANPQEVQALVIQKLKAAMPDYRIQVGSDPDWYEQVAILHRDTIESEGRTVKNLGADFRQLLNRK
ncbi:YhcN/YlaJ family sporulation lipoprotein [Ammoniphilus sp. YIM 78166]|uniref:YhcN/YlaJ family sporulation lipoprotein n=1 Tax=Ammoniphilus sp. YIM 78166 TaxID=1644106 RepID=UPI00106FF3C5|nr:YhcN/YlaJ family sporulation lipoprotein [Ammoniphilus sp. YIM 78166]